MNDLNAEVRRVRVVRADEIWPTPQDALDIIRGDLIVVRPEDVIDQRPITQVLCQHGSVIEVRCNCEAGSGEVNP